MLTIIRKAIGLGELDRFDAESEGVAFTATALRSFDVAMVRRLLARRAAAIALVYGDLEGLACAAALSCDWLALREGSRLALGAEVNVLRIAALFARAPSQAKRLLWLGPRSLDCETALAWQVADAAIPAQQDAIEWLERWLAGRSLI